MPSPPTSPTNRSRGSCSPTPSPWANTTTPSTPSSSPTTTPAPIANENSTSASFSATPPYSVGQTSQNDANANLSYPALDETIRHTYAARSTGTNKNSLYDSYVRAFRWATNRLQTSTDGGIIGFVSNGGWLDGNTADGIRASLASEFHHIYIYNLRGNQRTSGEQSRREGGKVFGSGSRNTITITLLVKQPGDVPDTGAQIHYRDIGDYLTRDQKLAILGDATIANTTWQPIAPNEHHDWLRQRDKRYDSLIPLAGPTGIFHIDSRGIGTGRDAWVYNSSTNALQANVGRMIDFYNQQVDSLDAYVRSRSRERDQPTDPESFVDRDKSRFSWNKADFRRMASGVRYELSPSMLRIAQYRPFMAQNVVFDRSLNHETAQMPSLFPVDSPNTGFSIADPGNTTDMHCIASNRIPDLVLCGDKHSKFFARWRYVEDGGDTLLGSSGPQRVSNLNPEAVARFRVALGDDITDDEVFAYVYGVLHSPEFRMTFEVNLKKEKPRIPLVEDRAVFDRFAQAGQELLDLHIGYETVDPYPLTENWRRGADLDTDPDILLVGAKRMKYPTIKDPETGEKVKDLTRLVYNDHLTLEGIPERVHDYKLGTRSGIDWIIDRWYVKTDKASGIVNDVNQWGLEQGNPRYIIDLVGRVVTVSLRTLDIIDGLPKLTF